MQSFNDRFNQTWYLDLDLATVRKCEAYEFPEHGKITFFPPSENLIQLLSETGVSFCLIWILCQDQITGKTFTSRGTETPQPIKNEEDFARCFDGTVLESSRIALFEELANFFPQMRTTLKSLIERFSSISQKLDQKASQAMLTELSDEKIDKILDDLFTEQKPLPKAMAAVLEKTE